MAPVAAPWSKTLGVAKLPPNSATRWIKATMGEAFAQRGRSGERGPERCSGCQCLLVDRPQATVVKARLHHRSHIHAWRRPQRLECRLLLWRSAPWGRLRRGVARSIYAGRQPRSLGRPPAPGPRVRVGRQAGVAKGWHDRSCLQSLMFCFSRKSVRPGTKNRFVSSLAVRALLAGGVCYSNYQDTAAMMLPCVLSNTAICVRKASATSFNRARL